MPIWSGRLLDCALLTIFGIAEGWRQALLCDRLKFRKLVQAAELAAKDAEDPLDAFMAQEILPEVKQKEQEETARKEEERKKLAQQLAVCAVPLLVTSADCSHVRLRFQWTYAICVDGFCLPHG